MPMRRKTKPITSTILIRYLAVDKKKKQFFPIIRTFNYDHFLHIVCTTVTPMYSVDWYKYNVLAYHTLYFPASWREGNLNFSMILRSVLTAVDCVFLHRQLAIFLTKLTLLAPLHKIILEYKKIVWFYN